MLWYYIRRRVPIACWSYDSLDYARYPAGDLIAMAQRHPPRAGDIILMHDDSGAVLRFSEDDAAVWKDAGYVFEALRLHA